MEAVSLERAKELAAMLEPICGKNPREVRHEDLEQVRKVYAVLTGWRP